MILGARTSAESKCSLVMWCNHVDSFNFSQINSIILFDWFFYRCFRLKCRVYCVRVPCGLSNDRQQRSCYKTQLSFRPFNKPVFQEKLFELLRKQWSQNHTTTRTRIIRTGIHCSIRQHIVSMPIPRSAGFIYNWWLCSKLIVLFSDYFGGRTNCCRQK